MGNKSLSQVVEWEAEAPTVEEGPFRLHYHRRGGEVRFALIVHFNCFNWSSLPLYAAVSI
ncbi:hypothetical protein DEO72_LG7g1451 [Vigna unguiculata]|uniref:Uncharacterized protein n=1 Tax=Vigna unguiculata TaxID=3917 RepID=A0A4D6MHB8_VIGUN|nr:hypothetical protein DEO72_LG7g1451 [Vigna unguiculata]